MPPPPPDTDARAARRVEACPPLLIYDDFLDAAVADRCFSTLLTEHRWPDNSYAVFGRRFTLPRQQTWHADPGIVYSYSNNLLQARAWTDLLLYLRGRVEAATGLPFNAVLVNLYRSGDDYVGWHSDDEIEMGGRPSIASLSLGAVREFSFRTKRRAESAPVRSGSIPLAPGSLLLMAPEFQHRWEHAVLPCAAAARINLTFRHVLEPAGARDES